VTFSVLLHDPETGETGAAVASKFLAVGALVLHARADSGAVATQALVNVSFGPDGLGLLRDGLPADEVVARLVAGDPSPDRRQLAVLGLDGRAAGYTGPGCMATAQHTTGAGFAAAGNVLAGPGVVDALAAALGAHAAGTPVARTVLAALRAGEAAGGDRRGRQSAAWSSAPAAATAAAPTGSSTCGWTTTRIRCGSWAGCWTCTPSCSTGPTRRTCCRCPANCAARSPRCWRPSPRSRSTPPTTAGCGRLSTPGPAGRTSKSGSYDR